MPKYLVITQWFGEAEPELKIVQAESENEVYEKFDLEELVAVVPLEKVFEVIEASASE